MPTTTATRHPAVASPSSRATTSSPPATSGPSRVDQAAMLAALACGSLDELIDQVVPAGIRVGRRRSTCPPA